MMNDVTPISNGNGNGGSRMGPLRKLFRGFAEEVMPGKSRVAPFNPRWEPPSVIGGLDADTMHGILAEAEGGYVERLFMLYRDLMVDSHLQGEFNKRKLAVLREEATFTPDDAEDPAAVEAATLVEDQWKRLKGKREALIHLLDSALYPVSVVEKVFKPGTGGLRFELDRLVPVPHHLLDYREGFLRIRDVAPDGRLLNSWHAPAGTRYIVHRGHLLTSFPDKWGGPMRAVLFWFLFKTMNREWWARFLDRFGAPFIVGKYESGDDRSRSELAQAFSKATKIFGLTIPTGTSVDLVQSATAQAGDAFKNFHDVANAELSKLVVGQTMTTEASANGMSGAQANVHQGVRDDIKAYDALALAETLRDDLFDQLLAINGNFAMRPSIAFGGAAEADAQAVATLITALKQSGLEPDDEAIEYLSRLAGFRLRRSEGGGLPFALSADDANLALAASGSAALSRALRQQFAGVSRAAGDSRSAEEFEREITALLSSGNGPTAAVLADSLASFGANGLAGD